jgi:peptide/nickel transport system permease protein
MRRLLPVLRAIGRVLPTLLGVVLLNFFLLKLAPGDAAEVLAGEMGAATPETMALLRQHLGVDVSVGQQLLNYLTHLAHFDLGYSARYGAPVLDVILSRLPATLALMTSAFALALVLGAAAGVVMSTWRDRWPDKVLSAITLTLYSMPSFWLGLMLVVLFSVKLGWLPSDGAQAIGVPLSGWQALTDQAAHLILPALALSAHFLAIYARLTRTAMLEVRDQDYVRTAHAKGLHPTVVTLRHVLRNALTPLTTVAGLHLAGLLGGAATVETVFSWPGLGRLALEAVQARDYSILLGVLLFSSLVVILANVLVDVLHGWLDPRSRQPEATFKLGRAPA